MRTLLFRFSNSRLSLLRPPIRRSPLRSGPSSVAWALIAALLLFSCADNADPQADTGIDQRPISQLEILDINAPGPAVDGSILSVSARGVDVSEDHRLTLRHASTGEEVTLEQDSLGNLGELNFEVTSSAITALGVGTVAVIITLEEGAFESEPYNGLLSLATDLELALYEVPDGAVYRNEEVVLLGAGFAGSGEGTLTALLEGDYVSEGASLSTPLSVSVDVELVEALSRDRGLLRLSTAIGGLTEGQFDGTVQLRQSLNGGSTAESATIDVVWDFQLPTIFWVAPMDPALGQIVTVAGGGFVGTIEDTFETTIFRIEGSVTDRAGTETDFTSEEIVATPRTHAEADFGVEVEVREEQLISSLFGIDRGRFVGTITPVTLSGGDELEGDPFNLTMDIDGMTQVVVVSFLPGFYDSLRHFGLASASRAVTDTALGRMRSIYVDYRVDFVSEPPAGFLETAYSRLEIGGPDPNGLGLLGYDNTPGKDVGNLRLFDTIGGTNAETQEDRFPGYGGVFIESFLYWSSTPGLTGSRPFGAPPPDPLFDEVFGPVRAQAATLEESQGEGSTTRVDQVFRAVHALGSMVGETSAHEVGHSLGLAQPNGSADAYHSPIPGDGCLMDNGSERPLGERMDEPGFAQAHFCYDEPEYLDEILGD